MMILSRLVSGLLQFFILIPFIFLSARVLSRRDIQLLFIVFLLFVFDNLILDVLSGLLLFKDQQWNWMGKFGSICWALGFTYFNRIITKKEIGWTTSFKTNSLKPAVILMLLLLSVRLLIYLIFKDGTESFHQETILFQASMPGIAEELVYRGIFLAILNKIWQPQWMFFKTHIGWGVILTSVLFGLVHGLYFDSNFHLHFRVYTLLLTGLWGFAFAILKERTGSLVPAIILHNAINLIGIH